MSLRLQVNLIITTLLAVFASALIGLQIDDTRRSVRDEIMGANTVARQLLSRMQWTDGHGGLAGMNDFLHQVGRIRANEVELRDDEGTLIYQSPAPTYKAGRSAPEWYSALVTPPLESKEIILPIGRIRLRADASRAVLDGWDDLRPMLWMVLAGFVLSNVLIYALMGRALRPLSALIGALRQVADGRYGTRLEGLSGREGQQISQAFNDMAQSVQDSLEAKRIAREAELALAQNREFTQAMQKRIELERAAISRELHDELGQQVTAIKSVGLAIARRAAGNDASIEQSARLVMQCADHIYDGMHRMIAKLRPLVLDQFGLYDALRDLLADCQLQHPDLTIIANLPEQQDSPEEALATAVYRIIQEALTNALRHAQATRIDVSVILSAHELMLEVRDNGVGRIGTLESAGHYGVTGMRERVQVLSGSFHIDQCEPRGIAVQVRLPLKVQDNHA